MPRRTFKQIQEDAKNNLKELKQKIKKKYPDIIYTHISKRLITNLKDKSNNQWRDFEPSGLYISKDYQYFSEMVVSSMDTYKNHLYGLQIKDKHLLLTIDKPPNKNKILNIKNIEDEQTFVDKYIIPDSQVAIKNRKYYEISIDFTRLAQDYAGILFTYDKNKKKMHVLKYEGYDIILYYFSSHNYGCIWRTAIIDNFILLAKYNIKSKKYITTF